MKLEASDVQRRLKPQKQLARFNLRTIGGLEYVPLSATRGAELLFEVFSRRHVKILELNGDNYRLASAIYCAKSMRVNAWRTRIRQALFNQE
uniref:hypothetical protein n=1 Tax=Pararhizobium sp. IMCC3301 TaxID=3067904 RepID=UPI0027423B33|nr:hypothetical protein [Pararhizobium sp. IMCC3301]